VLVAVEQMAELDKLTDLRLEQKLLGALQKSQEAWLHLPESFSSGVLAGHLNRALFIVIDSIYTKGGTPDPITIAESLPQDMQTELEKIGNWSFLEVLRDLPLDIKNVEFIAKDLIDLQTRRRIESAGEEISGMADDKQPVDKIIENIEVVISDIEGKGEIEVKTIGSDALEFIQDKIAHSAEVPGLASGFSELDKSVQGFQPGRLYVVGARKKTGKSMILLNWAKHLTVDLNIPVLWISTEHSQTDEFSRLLSLVSEVREVSINNGTFADIPVHSERVEKAIERISDIPFYFCSMPGFSLGKIKRLTRKFARVYGVRALFFDYVKATPPTANAKEWQELGILADGLKVLASTENLPVITAVQINREGAKEFKMGGELDSDYFAGSDRIAQLMSVGMILRKPTKKENPDAEAFRVLEVVDNRHGPANYAMMLSFQGEIIKIEEVTWV
jgi:replicative DNA helicase